MKPLFFPFLLAFVLAARAQGRHATQFTNYYDSLRVFDLGRLWRADSIYLQDDGTNSAFPEPIGFIGANYQRFDIHFLQVVKSRKDPYVYDVTGKTRVSGNICVFSGRIKVVSAKLDRRWERHYREGLLTAAVVLYEDSTKKGSGVITGRMQTNFCVDTKRRIFYDALDMEADGYYNNQCIAVWRSYRTHITKKCNWGDYRIPESTALDEGAGVFHVADEYLKNGWQGYDNDTTAWWQ